MILFVDLLMLTIEVVMLDKHTSVSKWFFDAKKCLIYPEIGTLKNTSPFVGFARWLGRV